MIVKTLVAAELATVAAATATGLDGTAEKIVLYGAALTGLAVLWRMVIKPMGVMIGHAGRIVKRTSIAVEALETLPAWRSEHDQRLSDVEAEMGIVSNDVAAIRRKLGVTDEDVRHTPPFHRARGGRL